MSEKTSILDKLPPVAENSEMAQSMDSAAKPETPTEPLGLSSEIETTVADSEVAFVSSQGSDKLSEAATKVEPSSAEMATTEAPEITISAVDSVTYHGLFAIFLFFLLSAIFVFSRRAKVNASAPQKALLLGGTGLILLAIYAFASKSLFAQFLNQTIDGYPVWLKPITWVVIAPLFIMTIPNLVTESAKAHKFFAKCALKATIAFVVLAIPALIDLGIIFGALAAIISIAIGVFFTLPLIKALRRLPGSLAEVAKSKISQLGFLVIGMILLQIVTGSLAIVNVATTPLLLIDLVASFVLVSVILMNLMSYISNQFPQQAAAH